MTKKDRVYRFYDSDESAAICSEMIDIFSPCSLASETLAFSRKMHQTTLITEMSAQHRKSLVGAKRNQWR